MLLSRVDLARLWVTARTASIPWLLAALGLYFAMIFVSAWRWGLLLRAQRIMVRLGTLLRSYLVATFFNNFLPSNIGGDVIRVRDTARAADRKRSPPLSCSSIAASDCWRWSSWRQPVRRYFRKGVLSWSRSAPACCG